MLLSKTEIEEMKIRYPDEKPTVFNYMQARADVFKLIDGYNTLLDKLSSLTPENILCLMEKKKFLILIDSSYVRDAQIFPGDYFINEGDSVGDYDSAWEDYEESMILGEYTASSTEQAIMIAAECENINPGKLIAYQIVD